jgi:DNA-binding MarR family transcriptional regulator
VARVKRDPELWRRQFVLAPMRAMLAAANRDILASVEAAGYPDVTIQHLNVFAQVPRDEGMRMSELAERLQVTPGAVTQLVQQLEDMGLVRRTPDPSDRRAVIVRPTPEAEAGYEAGRRRIAELEERWGGLVGPRRWATFKAVVGHIAQSEAGESAG